MIPSGPCILHVYAGWQTVLSADEEIMDLYMTRYPDAESTSASALGYIKTSDAMLHISFQLLSEIVPDPPDSDAGCLGRKARRAGKRARKAKKDDSREVSLQLYQDLGILSREQGDTGSVLWRSSLFFAKHVLQQHHSTPRNKSILFDYPQLARANVLELGCGTGLLAILLSPLCTSYTASDLLVNLQLCSRNLQLNSMFPDDRSGSKVTMQEIDWFDMPTVGDTEPTTIGDYSLILAIDCVYNEALAIPLINTMTRYCRPGSSTMALVVVELRSSDVVLFFLEAWMRAGWKIVRLSSEQMGLWDGRPGNWVGWVGWRS